MRHYANTHTDCMISLPPRAVRVLMRVCRWARASQKKGSRKETLEVIDFKAFCAPPHTHRHTPTPWDLSLIHI